MTEPMLHDDFSAPTPSAAPPIPATRIGARWRGAIEPALVGVIALIPCLVHLGHTPAIDELDHLLAVRSLLHGGTLRIPGGQPYTRAWPYTYLVAGAVMLFGDSPAAGRVPAVIAGVALVVAVFLTVRAVAGRAAAWTAALLLSFAPISIYLSTMVRFYTLHALLVWLGAMAVYTAAAPENSARRTIAWSAAAVLAMLAALELQVLTVFAVAGTVLWVALTAGPRLVRYFAATTARRAIVVAAAAAAAGVALWMLRAGTVARAIALFHHTDMWAAAGRDNLRYYDWLLLGLYPTLWTLFPVLALLALRRAPRFAGLCLCIFGVAFITESLASWKSEHYLFFAMPMLFAVTGVGVGAVLPWLRRQVEFAVERVVPRARSARLTRVVATVLLAGAGVFLAAGNGAASYSAKMLLETDATWDGATKYRGEADWAAARTVLAPVARSSQIVVATADVKAIYYLRRLDLLLYASELPHTGHSAQFALLAKDSVPVITTPASVEQTVACTRSGLIVADNDVLGQPWGIPRPTLAYLASHLARVPLRPAWRLTAFVWRHPDGTPLAPCPVPLYRHDRDVP